MTAGTLTIEQREQLRQMFLNYARTDKPDESANIFLAALAAAEQAAAKAERERCATVASKAWDKARERGEDPIDAYGEAMDAIAAAPLTDGSE